MNYDSRFGAILKFWVIGSIVATLAAGILAYALLFPKTPIDVKSVVITTPVTPAGGTLMYDFNYCKHVNTVAIVYRQMIPVDTSMPIVAIPAIEGITIPGCHTSVIPMTIPVTAAPGQYTLAGHLVYQINTFQSVSVDYTTAAFTVAPK